ncbi:MAG: flagellar motor protein MotB [Deltaproteobacteria bacterium]|nr:flagellar motor protein MotB [Deltaproteobacteria bacterium]
MARKQHHEEHENHERWLVSYADFITLLFAFFVVMYSVSRVDNKRLAQTAASIRWAMHFAGTGGVGAPPIFEGPPSEGGCSSNIGSSPQQGPPTGQAIENLRKKLERRLKPMLLERTRMQSVMIDTDGRRLTIRLSAARFFVAGSSALVPDALPVLDAVAEELADLKRAIRVEGHTDETANVGGRYRTNWELSSARAANVTAYLEEAHHIEPRYLSAVGFGSTRPLVPNDTPENREMNRRVAFVVEVGAGDPLGVAAP